MQMHYGDDQDMFFCDCVDEPVGRAVRQRRKSLSKETQASGLATIRRMAARTSAMNSNPKPDTLSS
jgi:hypothetical protein